MYEYTFEGLLLLLDGFGFSEFFLPDELVDIFHLPS